MFIEKIGCGDRRGTWTCIGTCVLHNMCEMLGDGFDQDWLEGINVQESSHTSVSSTTPPSEANAVRIRKAFMTYFTN